MSSHFLVGVAVGLGVAYLWRKFKPTSAGS